MQKYIYYFNKSPIGDLTIVSSILMQEFGKKKIKDAEEKETPIIKECSRQLSEYCEGKRKKFDIKLKPIGAPFHEKVWKALQDIPYGETRSYKDIAEAVKNPKACRAVGTANKNNPIPIIIPCHRVISHNGNIGGFSSGLDMKKVLIKIEKINLKEQKPSYPINNSLSIIY